MPQLQSVTVNDRSTPTPVAQVFLPDSRPQKDGSGVVLRTSTGVPMAEKWLSLAKRNANGKSRTRMLLTVPTVVTETINGVDQPRVIRKAYVEILTTFEGTHTQVERNNVLGIAQNALAAGVVLVNDTIVKDEGIW